MKIHHIGYLVSDIVGGAKNFNKLGFISETDVIEDPERKIKIVFMINDMYRIEIIQPIDASSAFYNLLKKYKNTAYHFCYEVDDIKKTVGDLRQQGYLPLQKISPAVALDNLPVVFLLNPQIGIIELLENKANYERIRVSI